MVLKINTMSRNTQRTPYFLDHPKTRKYLKLYDIEAKILSVYPQQIQDFKESSNGDLTPQERAALVEIVTKLLSFFSLVQYKTDTEFKRTKVVRDMARSGAQMSITTAFVVIKKDRIRRKALMKAEIALQTIKELELVRIESIPNEVPHQTEIPQV